MTGDSVIHAPPRHEGVRLSTVFVDGNLAARRQYGTTGYPIAILTILLLANVFNFIDRQLPYILAGRSRSVA